MGKLETSGIRPIVIKEITEFAKEYGLKEVILFGSRARGDYERASDIDLEQPLQEKLRDSIQREGRDPFAI
jgi:predicted nucleotidyltransferase